jgi:peptide-methionine (R)-S-oxide reductase
MDMPFPKRPRVALLVPFVLACGIAGLGLLYAVTATPTASAEADAPATRPTVSSAGFDLTGWDAERADRVAKVRLDELGYYVTREDGTERAFTSDLLDNKADGVYACAVCDLPVYDSATKFDSRTGWPSFWDEYAADHVAELEDRSHDMIRTEVECARCRSHLGHVFNDGPEPTGLRHCINGVAIKFFPRDRAPEPTTRPDR